MVDLTFLRKFTKDDFIKIKRYISLYLDVAPKTFEEMQRNIKAGEWDQLRIHAHSLKPQADFMGINNLKEALIKIEETVNDNNIDGMTELFSETREIAEQSEGLLREMLKQL